MKKSSLIFILILIASIAGCHSNSDEKPGDNNKLLSDYVVNTLNAEELKAKIKNRDGKILFINFWATWCVPCIEEFPALVRLAENYKERDVEFLSLSVDLVKEINSTVIPFLQKQKVNFPVYVIPEKESENVINLVMPDWNGAIPATAIFDEQGKLVTFLNGLETYESIKYKIDEVLRM